MDSWVTLQLPTNLDLNIVHGFLSDVAITNKYSANQLTTLQEKR